MSDVPSKDTQQFEHVLSRLDALIKRSHHEAASLPPLAEQAAPLELVVPVEDEPPAVEAGSPHTPFVVVESAPIPILTEIYEGNAAALQPPAQAPATAASLTPALMDVVDRALREELAQLQQSLAIRLHREITAALQQAASGTTEKTPGQQD